MFVIMFADEVVFVKQLAATAFYYVKLPVACYADTLLFDVDLEALVVAVGGWVFDCCNWAFDYLLVIYNFFDCDIVAAPCSIEFWEF